MKRRTLNILTLIAIEKYIIIIIPQKMEKKLVKNGGKNGKANTKHRTEQFPKKYHFIEHLFSY